MESAFHNSEHQIDLDFRIGVIIKRQRLSVGLTQKELAARVNVSQGCISLIEGGHRNTGLLNLKLLQSVSNELGYKLSELIFLAEQIPAITSKADVQKLKKEAQTYFVSQGDDG